MKALLLSLLIVISTLGKGQIWQADTLRYFSNVLDTTTRDKPDRMLTEDIFITIEKGKLNITKIDANFDAIITDTLDVQFLGPWIYMRNYSIRTVSTTNGKIYDMELHMMYYRSTLVQLALSRGNQLFLYHIVNQLIESNARETYFREWLREATRPEDKSIRYGKDNSRE